MAALGQLPPDLDGQIAAVAATILLTLALAATIQLGAEVQLPLIVGGLFINHLLAKAGLFWLAGLLNRSALCDWSALAGRPLLLLVFGTLLLGASVTMSARIKAMLG